MVEILLVPPPMVATVWPQALALLQPAIDLTRGCYEPEDVLAFCESGETQLWLAVEGEEIIAAYVTEIVNYPRKRRIRATFAGSRPHTMKEWLEPMVHSIELASRQWGCQGIEAFGRKGWSKFVDGEEVATFLCRDYPAMELN